MGGGGAQRVLWSLANYFCDNLGHNVFIATDLSSPSAYKFADKVNLVDLENGMSNKRGIIHYISTLFSIRRIYEEISPDIVISFQRGMNGMVLLSLLLAKVKIICCEHSFFLRKYGVVEDSLKRMLYWRANVVTVLTRHDLKICKKQNNDNFCKLRGLKPKAWKLDPSLGSMAVVSQSRHDKDQKTYHADIIQPCKTQNKGIIHQRNHNHRHNANNKSQNLCFLYRGLRTSDQKNTNDVERHNTDDQLKMVISKFVLF